MSICLSSQDDNALTISAKNSHLEMVQLLLDRGADPEAKGKVSIHRHPDLSTDQIFVHFSVHFNVNEKCIINVVCASGLW